MRRRLDLLYRAHGLRKTALRTLAHAGAAGVELMAVSGHASLDQVQEYLNEVDQERAADAAMAKLSTPATGAPPRPTHHRG
jgi:integrase